MDLVKTKNILYNDDFYNEQRDGSYASAKAVVPLILKITAPKSVIDVGCGVGTWLRAFEENGISEILGVDGDYVDGEKLLIAKDRFLAKDLSEPLELHKKFDLALSLEVAEHIRKSRAKTFIKNLVNLSDVIVFSAAVPMQGGTHHVNEQWPEYWQKMFDQHGYEFYDPFRPQIINLEGIEWWYKQNMFLAVNKSLADDARFKDLPKYNEKFLLLYRSVLKRNLYQRRLRQLLKKMFQFFQ